MDRQHDLGTKAWAAAGDQVYDFKTLDVEHGGESYRLATVVLKFWFDITTGIGGGCTGREILEWISNIYLKGTRHAFIPGLNMYEYFRLLNLLGFAVTVPPDIIANQTNDTHTFIVPIPFKLPFMRRPSDFSIPPEVIMHGILKLRLGVAALNANTTVNDCTITAWAILERSNDVQIPSLYTIGAHMGELTDPLSRGVYAGLAILPPTGGFAAAANLTNIRLVANGEPIHAAVPPDGCLVAHLNDHVFPRGMGAQAIGAVSQWWSANYASVLYFPLIWPSGETENNTIPNMVDSGEAPLKMDSDGSLTDPNYIYLFFNEITIAGAREMIKDMGANPDEVAFKSKTVSKAVISKAARLNKPGLKIMPLKIKSVNSTVGAGKLGQRGIPVIPRRLKFGGGLGRS